MIDVALWIISLHGASYGRSAGSVQHMVEICFSILELPPQSISQTFHLTVVWCSHGRSWPRNTSSIAPGEIYSCLGCTWLGGGRRILFSWKWRRNGFSFFLTPCHLQQSLTGLRLTADLTYYRVPTSARLMILLEAQCKVRNQAFLA